MKMLLKCSNWPLSILFRVIYSSVFYWGKYFTFGKNFWPLERNKIYD